jgi:hypothetical protein
MNSQTKSAKAPSFTSPAIPQILQMQMQALLQEQAALLDETQKTMAAWTKRRQEALDASLRTLAAMGSGLDPAAMTLAYSDWLNSSMSRIFEDMDSVREEALRVAQMGQKSMAALFRAPEQTGPEQEAGPEGEPAYMADRKAAE